MAFDEMPVSSIGAARRLIVVSNRLPFAFQRDEAGGEWRATPAAGGLVTALPPVLRHRGGIWIGWTGSDATEAIFARRRARRSRQPATA